MSLRTRFVVLFTLLAVIPLVGVGVFSHLRSIRAVETTGDPEQIDAATATAGPYLDHAWRVAYAWIDLRDRDGAIVYQMGEGPDRADSDPLAPRSVGVPDWLTLDARDAGEPAA
jgi:hypothetical protein